MSGQQFRRSSRPRAMAGWDPCRLAAVLGLDAGELRPQESCHDIPDRPEWYEPSGGGWSFCRLCRKWADDWHMQSAGHIWRVDNWRKVAQAIPEGKPEWYEKKGDYWWCRLCKKYADDKHMKSPNHAKQCASMNRENHSPGAEGEPMPPQPPPGSSTDVPRPPPGTAITAAGATGAALTTAAPGSIASPGAEEEQMPPQPPPGSSTDVPLPPPGTAGTAGTAAGTTGAALTSGPRIWQFDDWEKLECLPVPPSVPPPPETWVLHWPDRSPDPEAPSPGDAGWPVATHELVLCSENPNNPIATSFARFRKLGSQTFSEKPEVCWAYF